jgi:hypothetical protein
VERIPESETLVIEQMTENVLAKPVLQDGNIARRKGIWEEFGIGYGAQNRKVVHGFAKNTAQKKPHLVCSIITIRWGVRHQKGTMAL